MLLYICWPCCQAFSCLHCVWSMTLTIVLSRLMNKLLLLCYYGLSPASEENFHNLVLLQIGLISGFCLSPYNSYRVLFYSTSDNQWIQDLSISIQFIENNLHSRNCKVRGKEEKVKRKIRKDKKSKQAKHRKMHIIINIF